MQGAAEHSAVAVRTDDRLACEKALIGTGVEGQTDVSETI